MPDFESNPSTPEDDSPARRIIDAFGTDVFQVMADAAPVMIWLADTSKACTYFNKPWLEFTGRTQSEECGDGWADGVHPEDVSRCVDIYQSAFDRRESFRMEYRLRRHDGVYRWLLDHGVPLHAPGGEFIGYIGSCIDITDRMHMEGRLVENEERLRFAQECADAGTWDWNIATGEVTWSEGFLRLCGLKANLAPSYEAFLQLVHEDDRERIHAEVHEAIARREDVKIEFRVRHPEKGILWLMEIGRTSYDAEGRPLRMAGITLNVTDHLAVENALRESETLKSAVLESSLDCIIIMDQAGRIMEFNPAAEQTFGYSSEQAVGKTVAELLIPPRLRDAHTAGLARYLSEGVSAILGRRIELPAMRADGSEFECELAVAATGTNGKQFFSAHLRDITARKDTERKLHRSERELRMIFESATQFAIVVVGLDGQLLQWNVGAERLFGYSTAEALQLNFAALITGEDIERGALERTIKAVSGSGAAISERWHVRKDGTLFWGSGRAMPVKDDHGKLVGMLKIIQDQTARKRAEERLKESEERFRVLADSMPQIVWTASPDGQTDYLNRRWEEYTGLSVKDSIGDRWLEALHPEDVQLCREYWQAAVESGREYEIEFRFRNGRTGQYRWHLGRAVPIRDGEGRIQRWHGTATDIDDYKRAHEEARRSREQLRRYNEDLEQRVYERTRDLVRHQEKLRNLASELTVTEQRERRRLAAELHDYLAQLLVVCRMKLGRLSKFVRSDRATELIEDVNENLGECLKYTRTLVSDLSPTILFESGLPAAVRSLAEQMLRNDLTVTLQVDGEPVALADQQAIIAYQAIRELLFNVAKHAGMPEAGVRLLYEPGLLTVTVSDSGPGFDAAGLVDDPGTSGHFGLFSVRERLEAISGTLSIESSPATGTHVTFMLPVEPSAIPPLRPLTTPVPAEEPSRGGRKHAIRVLIADDHKMVREGLRTVIESNPEFEVVGEAQNGAEAVDLARSLMPGVVLMDVNMPVMNGIQATRRIKGELPNVSIIALSMHADEGVAASMRDAGASRYITKDGAFEELFGAIRDAGTRN